MKPFVDYYRESGISPVKQDISDLSRHYARRDALYRQLGIPPICMRDARVIEFGPGSGHNALFTASLNPKKYVLVDANPQGVHEMHALFAQHGVGARVEIVESLVEDFKSSDAFEFVLAEGMLPYSYDPQGLTRKIASFTEMGGVLVVTCADPAAAMGEVLRRFVARRFVEIDRDRHERVRILAPIFEPHLRTLSGMTRSVEDWILDNIVHPFTGKLFGIDDAIQTLGAEFDVYATAPHFLLDWRWYKRIAGDGEYNARAAGSFRSVVCNMLDYRSDLPPHDEALGTAVLASCDRIYGLMQRSEMDGADVHGELLDCLEELRRLTAGIAPATAASLASLQRFLSAARPDAKLLADFEPFFGRGMQYLSLIRRPDYR